ncbi:hypothetical protein [Helicobacter sp. 23-1045]
MRQQGEAIHKSNANRKYCRHCEKMSVSEFSWQSKPRESKRQIKTMPQN